MLIQRSGERFCADHGWLQTCHSFSFAEYQDPDNQHWGALRVFNDDRVAPAQGFPTHPHRDMEILTYVLSGELEHQDSMGNRGVVRPGGVQYMSAGTGVRHSEFNHSASAELHFVQMWVLPPRPGLPPQYGQRDFSTADRLDRLFVAASGRPGIAAPIALQQDAALVLSRLADTRLRHVFDPGRLGFLFVAEGTISANGETLGAGDAARMSGIAALDLMGTGELVLWDVPEMAERRYS
ncbi:MAG: pirin family protein [Candidatus Eremiobacteraeota bacterium]|nr:pirin family protein [Candidatus Eremiobacteraeota bacterium]